MVQPKDCILDIYGGFGREIEGSIPVAALLESLALFGIDAQAGRAAIARMKRSGLLDADRRGGVAAYALTAQAIEILADGDRRLFRQPEYDGRWVVVTLSVPESERRQRYLIKSRLARIGFGQGPANTWLAPAANLADAQHTLSRHQLDGYVSMWVGEYAGFGDLADVVGAAWDLDSIAAQYRQYMSTSGTKYQLPDVRREAFVDCLVNLERWRPLALLDPGLPPAVTPPEWPAEAARQLFIEIDQQLRPLARDWFHERAMSATFG